jgi:hypothetical protein
LFFLFLVVLLVVLGALSRGDPRHLLVSGDPDAIRSGEIAI